jgi:predicted kinase
MALIDGHVIPFDCIEFNEALRWIDVMSEIAFVVMDLQDRQQPRFAYRFLNRYLQQTGDYAGVALLSYYLVYRALVRAMVILLRLQQEGLTDQQQKTIRQDYQDYVRLALSYTRQHRPVLMITHGVSGTGKSTLAEKLVEILGALRVRSDVERKRLFHYAIEADTQSTLQGGIYTPAASRLTYEQLAMLTTAIINAGYSVILDAAFLKRSQRDIFRHLAARLGTPFIVLDLQAAVEILQKRVLQRQMKNQDASEAGIEVLETQLRAQEPLAQDELPYVLRIAADESLDAEAVGRDLLTRIGGE